MKAPGVNFSPADFSALEATVSLPEGYIIATSSSYPLKIAPITGRPLNYSHSVQLLCKATGDMPRGTGETEQEALAAAISKIPAPILSDRRG